MKLFCAELILTGDEKTAKAVVVNKHRSGYTLLNNYITEPENLKALSGDATVLLSADFYDTIIETLKVPMVKDHKTFGMLAKNKLKDRTEEGTEYLFAYKVDDTSVPDNTGNVDHKVYMIPEQLFRNVMSYGDSTKAKVNMVTLSDFALCGLSDKAFPAETVFHAFADDEKIIVNVSRGKTVIYTRILDYEPSGGSSEGVFYESLNLTYMFVTKNLHVDVDRMILSGKLTKSTELSTMLFDFNGKVQSVLIANHFISSCSNELFHSYMIPIGLCYLDEAYDFTPYDMREERGFGYLKMLVNIVLLAAVLIMAYVNAGAMSKMFSTKMRYDLGASSTKVRMDKYLQNYKEIDDKKYVFYYLMEQKRVSSGPFSIYDEVADMIDAAGFDNVSFQLNSKGNTISINEKMDFKDIKAVDNHRFIVESFLDSIRAKKRFKVTNSSTYNMDGLFANIRIVLVQEK